MEKNEQTNNTTNVLNEQRLYAMLHSIPILRESEISLFADIIALHKPKAVLEIGTAIGYSTLLMAENMDPQGQIVTIELDENRYKKAKEFCEQTIYKDAIHFHVGDADTFLDSLEGSYDLVFLDGPKGQYLKQLKKIMPHLRQDAVILADNVLFRGYVEGHKEVPRRFRTICKRLQEYLTFVRQKNLFNTTLYPMGDGMSVSIWKGYNENY